MPDLIKIALAYARLGWRIHPIRPREKLPILKDWPARATTDQAILERWFGRSADANVAVATGQSSGIFVLDVDGPEGEKALVDLERRHGDMPELYPMQWTGSGHGWQAFFAWPEGRTIRNSAGRLGPKLDTRGDGGYVLLPPSIHPSGRRYRWAEERTPTAIPPEPAPAWLVELLDPPETAESADRRTFTTATYRSATGEDRYAAKALKAELALVALAPDGSRNDQLNASAHALFRLVADRRLSRDITERGLTEAALHAGLTKDEIKRTIESARKSRGLG